MTEFITQCSHCGDEYLHHVAVDLHHRVEEDSDTASIRVYGGMVATTENPSSRRSGISILLWCEHCHGLTELTIAQHKGQTFIAFKQGDKESGQVQ